MKQVLIALDQIVNTVIPLPKDGWGYADETLSARLFRCHLMHDLPALWYRLVDAVFFFDPNHCYESWIAEWQRRQLPDDYK